MKKHTYRAAKIDQLRLSELIPLLMGGCIVAVDVAKTKFVAALATAAGEVVKLFRFDHPTQTRQFLELLGTLSAAAFHVARGATFEAGKLFDERRLSLSQTPPPPRRHPKPRTQPRRTVAALATATA